MKKILSLVLALVLCLGVMSISLAETDVTWNINNPMFPLEEPVTITVFTFGYTYNPVVQDMVEKNKDWQALVAATNINFDFVQCFDTDVETQRRALETRLLNDDYGEAIWSFGYEVIATSDLLDMAAAGKAVDLTPYITPEIMPNLCANVSEDLMKNFKATDGGIYALRPVTQTNAFISTEGMLYANMDWVGQWQAAAGKDHTPETIEEMEEMLTYFRDNDMNGNGDATDEIPWFMTSISWGGCMTFEHAMSSWGFGTKDTPMDKNIVIDDEGKVSIAQTSQNWKDAITVLGDWYRKGLIYQEAFTANNDTNTAIYNEAGKNIGLYNAAYPSDGFEVILPPKAEGYETRVFLHPTSRTGVDNPTFILTDKCKNPEIMMAFMDLFYEPLNSVIMHYGTTAFDPEGYAAKAPETNVLCSYGEDGKIYFQKPENEDIPKTIEDAAVYTFVEWIGSFSLDVIDANYDAESFIGNDSRVRGYLLYQDAGVLNPIDCVWGRYAILDEDQEDLNFYYNDVSAITAEYRAKFITGEYDIDAQWDEFQTKLENAGVNEMAEIIQRAYDAFLAR